MKKVENYKIGEKVPFGRLILRAIKGSDCSQCILKNVCRDEDLFNETFGSCYIEDREDKTNIIFVKDD